MATPLSDQIRALIAYANETTEAGDVRLGDCVKTLCDGYNGGGSAPSSPLVVPSGALSSRLAALLAYANETTGKGDTLLGDAIRNLCDGYGAGGEQGELVFYDYLQSDGAAYIETGIGVDTQTFICKAKQMDRQSPVFGATSNFGYAGYSNNNYTRGYNFSSYIQVYSSGYVSKILEYKLDMTGFYVGTTKGTKARGTPSGTLKLFSMTGAEYGNAKIYDMKILSVNGELLYHFLPCTCNGVAGMWDMVGWKFYGNSNTSGAFTAENDN